MSYLLWADRGDYLYSFRKLEPRNLHCGKGCMLVIMHLLVYPGSSCHHFKCTLCRIPIFPNPVLQVCEEYSVGAEFGSLGMASKRNRRKATSEPQHHYASMMDDAENRPTASIFSFFLFFLSFFSYFYFYKYLLLLSNSSAS
jgi:hypothetical protein